MQDGRVHAYCRIFEDLNTLTCISLPSQDTVPPVCKRWTGLEIAKVRLPGCVWNDIMLHDNRRSVTQLRMSILEVVLSEVARLFNLPFQHYVPSGQVN